MAVTGKAFAEKADVAYQEKWGYIWATAGENWTAKKQEALIAKYQSDPAKYVDYRQGAEYGDRWIGHKVTDCSGLVKKTAELLGLKGILHGSNSQFNKQCTKTGKIEKGIKIPIGALIFTGTEGQHNHVGILISDTCVCEAKGTLHGVVHTPITNKKWTYWGLLKGVKYENTTTTQSNSQTTKPTTTKKYPTLQRGNKGDTVKFMQELLAKDGSELTIDGIFGKGTQSAVMAFQKRHGLVVDGIVGPKTWAELLKLAD